MPLDTDDLTAISTLVADQMKEAQAEFLKAAKTENDKEIDRRINQILEKVDGKKKDDPPEPPKPTPATTTDPALQTMQVRFLKQAVKEQVADLPEAIRGHVREMALEAAGRMTLATDADEDRIAKDLVESFKGYVEKVKTSSEEGLREDLKSRKLLLDEKKNGDQPPDGGDADPKDEKDPKKLFDKGAEIAKKRFGQGKE